MAIKYNIKQELYILVGTVILVYHKEMQNSQIILCKKKTQCYSTCLLCARPWIQFPTEQNNQSIKKCSSVNPECETPCPTVRSGIRKHEVYD